MQNTPKGSKQQQPLLAVIKRLLVLAILITAFTFTSAQADGGRYSCYYGEQGGYTFWMSCGGSAGNFVYKCSGGICEDCNEPSCNDLANQYCSAGSCSPPIFD